MLSVPTVDTQFKILHPKTPPPKSNATSANDEDDKKTIESSVDKTLKVRKNTKKSPEKLEQSSPQPQQNIPPPSIEKRTRSHSQSSPGSLSLGINGNTSDREGMTTRSGTVMRSPSGEPPISVLKGGSEKRKRPRSGDSSHSGDGERIGGAKRATADVEDRRRRKSSGGSVASSSSSMVWMRFPRASSRSSRRTS